MELIVGKYYKLRSGAKAKVIVTKRPKDYSVVIMYNHGELGFRYYDGAFYANKESVNDIVSEWKETKKVKLYAYACACPVWLSRYKDGPAKDRLPEFDQEIDA